MSLGLGVLFGKLQQGAQENRQVLTIARMRAEAEELYGSRLSDIAPATDRLSGGFSQDDGATVRKVCLLPTYTCLLHIELNLMVESPRHMMACGRKCKMLLAATSGSHKTFATSL
jgi:hypothetical protein